MWRIICDGSQAGADPGLCSLGQQPPTCPWGGMYQPVGANCQYSFTAAQRKQAAEWAINWTAKACPLFCAFDFYRYVTPPAITPVPYNYDCANPSNTDCANFVSQALFYGGLPLTYDWFCYYVGTANGLCNRGQVGGNPSKWSYALRGIVTPTPSGVPTLIPNRAGLPAYLGDHLYLGKGAGSVDTILLNIPNLNTNSSNDVNYVFKSLAEAPLNTLIIPTDIGNLMATLDNYGFTYGDIIYTNKNLNEHVFMIVGWGPYVETWSQLLTITPWQLRPHRTTDAPVLYIVDHGPQQIRGLKYPSDAIAQQLKMPKPYYASRWLAYPLDETNWIGGDRHFIKIPNSFTLPVGYIRQAEPQTAVLKQNMQSFCPVATLMATATP